MKKSAAPSVSIAPRRGGFVVQISGVVDERFDGTKVQALRGPVVFDLDGVSRITSSGVRKWIEMLGALQTQAYCFVNCRPAMVSQFNLVRGFGGNGQIVTLYAPYVCEKCGEEVNQRIDLRRQHAHLTDLVEAGVSCPSCGAKALFDDYAPEYFECVTSIPPPTLSAALSSVLDGDGHVKIVKDVTPTFTALWISGVLDGTTQFRRVADGLDGLVLVVLQEVIEITERGHSALTKLTEMEDVELVVARVPLSLLSGLRRSRALGRAKVASLFVSLTCPSCNRVDDLEIDQKTFGLLTDAGIPRLCDCGMRLDWKRDEVVAAVEGMPWTTPPEEVVRYLAARRGARQDGSFISDETLPAGVLRTATPTGPGAGTGGSVSTDVHAIARRYELLQQLASGGMGVVFLGRVVGAGGFERRVAIKRIHPHLAQDAQFVAMFLDEARIAARIHHPNVVATLDVENGPDGLFLVMEYIEGLSAEDLIAAAQWSSTPPPIGVAVRVVLDLLAGLHAAHELTETNGEPLHLVHRDVSPANLLIGLEGVARLSDFGIAHAQRRLAVDTDPGSLKGKLGYMSPEQLSKLPVDRRSDVYAAGVVLWELLAGRWLFGDEVGRGILREALEGPQQSPREVNPDVPEALSATCMTALAREASARYETAAAFAEQLEAACQRANVTIASATAVAELVRRVAGSAIPASRRPTPARSAG